MVHTITIRCDIGSSECLQPAYDLSIAPLKLRLRLQGTLDNLRIAMRNTRIMCAVMLDTKVSDTRDRVHMSANNLRSSQDYFSPALLLCISASRSQTYCTIMYCVSCHDQ